MSNIEQGILNIEVMNRCAPSFSINGWQLLNSWNRYSISLHYKAMAGQVLDIPAPSRGPLEPTRSMGGVNH